MSKLEIVYLPPGDLTPYENNTRKHSATDKLNKGEAEKEN